MNERNIRREVARTEQRKCEQAYLFGMGCAQLSLCGRFGVALMILCRGNARAEVLVRLLLGAAAVLAMIGFCAMSVFCGRHW